MKTNKGHHSMPSESHAVYDSLLPPADSAMATGPPFDGSRENKICKGEGWATLDRKLSEGYAAVPPRSASIRLCSMRIIGTPARLQTVSQ